MSVLPAKILDRVAAGAILRAAGPMRALREAWSGYEKIDAVREIVCVKFWGIGNAALMLPALHALRRRYPRARLSVVTLATNAPIFHGVADRVLTVRSRPLRACVTDLTSVLARLRRTNIDLAIDFEQFVKTSQLLLFVARARQIFAFDTPGQKRAGLAHVRVPYANDRHTGDSFFDLVRAAGVTDPRYEAGGLTPERSAAARLAWRLPSADNENLVVLHPGSGDNFPGRRWPAQYFGEVARRLRTAGYTVVVTGSHPERALAAKVMAAAGPGVRNFAGRLTLSELVALLARSALLISNDTGPVHLASALHVPVVAMFGPNTPELYGPRSPGSVAFYEPPPCAPCITNYNYKTSRCRNPVCMQRIDVERVTAAAMNALETRRSDRACLSVDPCGERLA